MSMAQTSELHRPVSLAEIGGTRIMHEIDADAKERDALIARFDLLALDRLNASAQLWRDDDAIWLKGSVQASLAQACIATGDPVWQKIDEGFTIRFVAETGQQEDAELELVTEDCDTIYHDGRIIDIGEAVAQTLGLALDPFPRSANADTILQKAGVKKEGEEEIGPFAALAALKGKLK